MFAKNKVSPIRNVIRTDSDEWPKNNESWCEFMVRTDREDAASAKVGMIVVCLIFLPFVAWMIVEALDKAFT